MYNIPDCTLITSYLILDERIDFVDCHANGEPIITSNGEPIITTNSFFSLPCYLVIFCTKETISALKKKRSAFNLLSMTMFIEIELKDMWTYQYLNQIRTNRFMYYPTGNFETDENPHLINCNKFDFMLQVMNINPFKTSKFGWVNCFFVKKDNYICERYTFNDMLYVLRNITDKFHIQVLNVCDKKYKLQENKHEYYNQFRYIVCGGFFTCSDKVGRPILNRLKDIFVQTTNAGYGHGEEMLFLEVLDEFKDDINKSYGDYAQLLNNFIRPIINFHYIYYFVLHNYIKYGYFDEAYECAKVLISVIDSYESDVCSVIHMKILFDYYLSVRNANPDEVQSVVNYIQKKCANNPQMKKEFEKNQNCYGFPALKN